MHTGAMPSDGAPTLVEISSDAGTSRLPLRGESVTIGRTADNDVVLDNEPTVSRRHAELFRPQPDEDHGDDGAWRVRDLGSHNGTHVNGERLNEGDERAIGPDDVVGLGAVTLRLVADVADVGLTVEDRRGAEMHRLLTALSAREREVLTLVAAGHTDDQCAKALFISVKTVHSHLDRIRDKTGVRRRAELTRLAVRLGLSTS